MANKVIGKTFGPFMANPTTGALIVEPVDDDADLVTVAVDVAKNTSHSQIVAKPGTGKRILVVAYHLQGDDVTDDQIGRISLEDHETAKAHIVVDTEGSGVALARRGGLLALAEDKKLCITTNAYTTAVGGISYKVKDV